MKAELVTSRAGAQRILITVETDEERKALQDQPDLRPVMTQHTWTQGQEILDYVSFELHQPDEEE